MSVIELHRLRAVPDLHVAIKQYSKETLIKNQKAEEAMMEKECLSRLQHPLVIRLFQTYQSVDSLFFVLEFCPFGDLVDVVRRSENKRLALPECFRVSKQIVAVVQFLHANGYTHRDVKAENILMGSDRNIRLIDFATAHQEGSECKSKFVGSPQYIAPEVINGEGPSPKVDLFGVGCVVYYLWTGKHAFLRESDFLTWKAILNEPLDLAKLEGTPPDDEPLRLFIANCVEKDPSQRSWFPLP